MLHTNFIPSQPNEEEKLKYPGEQVQHLSSSIDPTFGRQSQTPVSYKM